MARDRIIPADLWTREAVIDCAPMTRLLFIGLWNFADDFGVQPLRPRTLRMQVFPGDPIDNDAMRAMLDELATHGLVRIYAVDGVEYVAVSDWEHFQRVGKRARRRYPPDAAVTMANHRNVEASHDRPFRAGLEQPASASENHSNAQTPRSPPACEAGEQPSRIIANHSNVETLPEPPPPAAMRVVAACAPPIAP